ncbi:hypothetical protein ABF062_004899, partial [Escherichia coli]
KHLTGQFGDMLARIESGEFPEGTILLVEAIDRIGRLEHLETVFQNSSVLRQPQVLCRHHRL